ncbi:phosphatidylethanolamine-binding protein [Entophlyctis helioformis]|nr:phosphatidylethanolamine-binding protein [Entophlyctis helioformis]
MALGNHAWMRWDAVGCAGMCWLHDLVPCTAAMEKLRRHTIELGLSDPANHRKFADGSADLNDPVFASMALRQFETFVRPKLLKASNEWELMKDVFPADFVPSVNVQLNFGNKDWLAPFGQHIDAHTGIHSPRVVITTDPASDKTEYFTLILTNLDRANLEFKSYEEWCHWLVTDIPVTRRLEIPSAASPFFKADRLKDVDPSSPYASLPEAPADAKIPGNVVFEYVPPHPAFSNPRKVNRYVLIALRQSGPNIKVDMDKLKASAESQRVLAEQRMTKEGRSLAERPVEGEGEKALSTRERFLALPTMKFAKKHNLELAGYGFVTSSWNVHTPHMFTGLGVHEPVFGKQYRTRAADQAIRLGAATDMAASLKVPVSQLPRDMLTNLNAGRRPSFDVSRVVTSGDIQLDLIRKKQAEAAASGTPVTKVSGKKAKAAAAAAAAGTARSAGLAVNAAAAGSRPKTHRLTEYGATAIVRNKEGDVASSLMGDVTASIKLRRNRYANI